MSLSLNLCLGQNDGQPEGLYGVGRCEGGGRQRVSKTRNKERMADMSIHIVVLYFLVVPPTVLN